jgi:ATP-dependent RNA helicase DDX1
VRTNSGFLKGQHYYEVTVNDKGGCRFGWATRAAKLDLGTDNHGFGYGFAGKKSNNRQFTDYGEAYTEGDVIGCYLDCRDWTITYSKNGKLFDTAFQIPITLQKGAFYPTICLKVCPQMKMNPSSHFIIEC